VGNISGLSQISNAATALSNLILVSPQSTIGYQPQNPPSANSTPAQLPPSLLFHYEGENTATLQSDITDHYIEDNTAIQDQIALKPEEITTHGFIGELNDVPPAALAIVKTVADKLTVINAYTPALSVTALLAYNTAFQAYQVAQNAVNSAVSSWSTVTNSGGESVIGTNGLAIQANQTKQQQMFQQFYGYWRNRTLFTVQTPWAVFQNMAIKNLRAIQDATTNVITDFEITFKMLRFASTQQGVFDPSNAQGRAATQGAGTTNLGTSTPIAAQSLTSGLASNYPGLGVSA
jgi:hypothetical protein